MAPIKIHEPSKFMNIQNLLTEGIFQEPKFFKSHNFSQNCIALGYAIFEAKKEFIVV